MSYRISRKDESGTWGQGPFDSVELAQMEVSTIIAARRRAGEKYKKATPSHGEVQRYVSDKGGTITIRRN